MCALTIAQSIIILCAALSLSLAQESRAIVKTITKPQECESVRQLVVGALCVQNRIKLNVEKGIWRIC